MPDSAPVQSLRALMVGPASPRGLAQWALPPDPACVLRGSRGPAQWGRPVGRRGPAQWSPHPGGR
eukprot:13961226-Alexandrium_andersonii.AAC.1